MVRTKLITTLTPRTLKQMAKKGVGHSNLESLADKLKKDSKKKKK